MGKRQKIKLKYTAEFCAFKYASNSTKPVSSIVKLILSCKTGKGLISSKLNQLSSKLIDKKIKNTFISTKSVSSTVK